MLPDPNKPHLLFTDASRFCYSGVLTQASTADFNEALLKIFTSKAPLKALNLKDRTFDLQPISYIPVAYISGSFSQSQCRWPAITKECFSIFISIKKYSFYIQNADLLVCSDHKPLLKNLTGHTDNDKCNTWGLEATGIPRRVKI